MGDELSNIIVPISQRSLTKIRFRKQRFKRLKI